MDVNGADMTSESVTNAGGLAALTSVNMIVGIIV